MLFSFIDAALVIKNSSQKEREQGEYDSDDVQTLDENDKSENDDSEDCSMFDESGVIEFDNDFDGNQKHIYLIFLKKNPNKFTFKNYNRTRSN